MNKKVLLLTILIFLLGFTGCFNKKEEKKELKKKVVRTTVVDGNSFEHSLEKVNLRGTFNAWGLSEMVLVGDYTWELTINTTDDIKSRFKFDLSNDWSDNYGDDGADGTLEAFGDDISLDANSTYKITLNETEMSYTKLKDVQTKITIQYEVEGNLDAHKKLRGKRAIVFQAGEKIDEFEISSTEDDKTQVEITGIELGSYVIRISDNENSLYIATPVLLTESNNQFVKTQTIIENNSGPFFNKNSMYFRGTSNGWTTGYMQRHSDYIWKIRQTFGDTSEERFKFDVNGDWTENYGDTDGDYITELFGEDIKVESGKTYDILYNDGTGKYYIKEVDNTKGEINIFAYTNNYYKTLIVGQSFTLLKNDEIYGEYKILDSGNVNYPIGSSVKDVPFGEYKATLDFTLNGTRFFGEAPVSIAADRLRGTAAIYVKTESLSNNVVVNLSLGLNDLEKDKELIGKNVNFEIVKDGITTPLDNIIVTENENGNPVVKFNAIEEANYNLKMQYYDSNYILKYIIDEVIEVEDVQVVKYVDVIVSRELINANVKLFGKLTEEGNEVDSYQLMNRYYTLYKDEVLLGEFKFDDLHSNYSQSGSTRYAVSKLKLNDVGSYKVVVDEVAELQGQYTFAKKHFEGETTFELTEEFQIKEVYIDVNATVLEEKKYTFDKVNVRGTFNGWGNTPMELVSDNTWKVEIITGDDINERLKFDRRGDWELNYGDNDGDNVAELGGDDISLEANTAYIITLNDDTLEYTLVNNTELGSAKLNFSITGITNETENFGLDNVVVNLSKDGKGRDYRINAGDSTNIEAKLSIDSLFYGTYIAKIVSNTYTGEIEFTLDDSNPDFEGSVEVTKNAEFASNLPKLYFRGTANGWGKKEMVLVEDNVWRCQAYFKDSETERFKLDVYGDWTENYGDTDLDGIAELFGEDLSVSKETPYEIRFNDETKELTYNSLAGNEVVLEIDEVTAYNVKMRWNYIGSSMTTSTIYRSETIDGEYEYAGSTYGNDTEFTDTRIEAGKTYYYYIYMNRYIYHGIGYRHNSEKVMVIAQ